MERERIIEKAQEVTNGTKLEIRYLKPADVLNTRNYLKSIGTPDAELPKLKEGGSEPSKKLYKRTTYTFIYDERSYFNQCLEEQAQNLNPMVDQGYQKIKGIYYTKENPDTKEIKDYVRFAIRQDRIKIAVKYTTDKKGTNEVEYKDIEPYLQASAKKDYECYNRQLGLTSTGQVPDVEIKQMTLDVDKILSINTK